MMLKQGKSLSLLVGIIITISVIYKPTTNTHLKCEKSCSLLEGDMSSMDLTGLDSLISKMIQNNKERASTRSCEGLKQIGDYRILNIELSDIINANQGASDLINTVLNGGLDDTYSFNGEIEIVSDANFDTNILPENLLSIYNTFIEDVKLLDFQDITSESFYKQDKYKDLFKFILFYAVKTNSYNGIRLNMPIKSGFVENNPNRLGQQLGSWDQAKRDQFENLLEPIDSYEDMPDGMFNVFFATGSFTVSLINCGNDAAASLEINDFEDVQALVNAIATHETLHDLPDLGHNSDPTHVGIQAPGFSIFTWDDYFEDTGEWVHPPMNQQIREKLLEEHKLVEYVTSTTISHSINQMFYNENLELIDSLILDQGNKEFNVANQLDFEDCNGNDIDNQIELSIISNTAPIAFQVNGEVLNIIPLSTGSGLLTLEASFNGDESGDTIVTEVFTYPIQILQSTSNLDVFPESEIQVYPNPTPGKLYVSIPDNSVPVQFELYSSNGEFLKSFQNGHDLNLSDFNKGIYLIRVNDEQLKTMKVLRVVKI